MKTLKKHFHGIITALLVAYFLVPPLVVHAALGAATALMSFGMAPELANYITGKLVNVDASGNLVLPIASGKKLSYTVGGTEQAFLSNVGISSQNGLAFPTTAEEAVAGAGTTVSDAASLSTTAHIHQITGANGTVGWKFGAATPGQFEILLGTTAGVAKVYAAAGGTCNGGSTDAACTLTTGILPHICYATTATAWICA